MSCCRGTSDEVATGSDDARCVPPFSQLPARCQWHPGGLSTHEPCSTCLAARRDQAAVCVQGGQSPGAVRAAFAAWVLVL